jgi:hypothetical protein
MFYVHHTPTTTADMLECSREARKESDREKTLENLRLNGQQAGATN